MATSPVIRSSSSEPVQVVSLILGQRVGYGLFGLALVVFFIGLIGDFTGGISTAIIVCVVIGSIVLARQSWSPTP